MAGTLTTNSSLGLGYQTGQFSGILGSPVDQAFFNAAFAGRINTNKIYKESYHCNIVQDCTMSTWIEEYMGYDTECLLDSNNGYSLIETYGQLNQIKVKTTVTIPANPSTGIIALDNSSQFVSGAYVLPQVGNTIVLSPSGVLAEITAVTHATGFDTTITVKIRSTTAGSQVVTSGDTLLVLSGSFIADCACPAGQFSFPDLPVITDLSMISVGDKGDLCGDALNKCQWLKIDFTDECGNTITNWYTEALQNMYKRFEQRKHYENLLNPNFGIIPIVKARGMKFTESAADTITVQDVRDWKQQFDIGGIGCREYAIFAGGRKFSQFQQMLQSAGVTQLNYIDQPLNDCKWINLNYCGIRVEGLTLHIYEECSFSNGKLLGGPNMVYPDSAIWVPLCNRPACTRSNNRGDAGSQDDKMLSMVYFKSVDGRVWDNLTDSNGILNGPGGRNTFGTGCEEHQWTIKSRWLLELHCGNAWGYMGL